jgi:putative two-component system response regulator
MGKHFDPDVVDAFLDLNQEFQEIATRYADSEQELQIKAAFLDSVVGDESGKETR